MLPIELSIPIFTGGLIRAWTDHRYKGDELMERRERGVLFGSGLIAGAAIISVIIAVLVGTSDFWGPIGRLVGHEADPAAGIAGSGVQGLTHGLGGFWPLFFFGILMAILWWKANGRLGKKA